MKPATTMASQLGDDMSKDKTYSQRRDEFIRESYMLFDTAHSGFQKGYDHCLHQCKEVMDLVEAVRTVEYQSRTRGYPTGGEWMRILDFIQPALANYEAAAKEIGK